MEYERITATTSAALVVAMSKDIVLHMWFNI